MFLPMNPLFKSPVRAGAPTQIQEISHGHSLRRGRVVLWILIHLAALTALFKFHASVIPAFFMMLFVAGCLGITIGYHRLLTHGSFKTYPVVRFLLCACGTLSLFGGPVEWVGYHRRHHAHTEEERDPHSPRDGFLWAHFEWLLFRHPFDAAYYAKDVMRDKGLLFLERFSYLPPFLSLVVIYLVGTLVAHAGVAWLLWVGAVRSVLAFHSAGLVNSWTHRWGYRNFNTNDDSRNSPFVALLSFGEGWHNNHHAQQRSASHGMKPREFDVSYLVIRLMERAGLAWDVVRPDLSMLSATTEHAQTESAKVMSHEKVMTE